MLVSILSVSIYLLAGLSTGGPGFPLDDAWIHQTYARNLALNSEWAFQPGQPSAGSTSPFWTLLLTVGQAARLGPYPWTYLLGGLLLWGLAFVGMLTFSRLRPERGLWGLAAGVFLALEWHLVWAAASGMETLLQAFLVLLVLYLLLELQPPWLVIGVLIGTSVWVRPDGVTLLGPALMVLALTQQSRRGRVLAGLRMAAGVGLLFVPYLLFNQLLAGSWWPNTYFAKQAEYAVELNVSLISRLGEQAILPMIGAGALLLPGFIYSIVVAARNRSWASLAGSLWFLGYIGLYALRLPVTYQHGRYIMPAMPVYLIWGLAGVASLVKNTADRPIQRILSRAWLASIAILLAAFYLLGANAYRTDVAVIQSEMVAAASWVAENTDPGALVAAHDIGALGYFADRRLLDMAGLVSPEVIPFIRDESRLAEFLNERGADYLVTFPGWYPDLVKQLQPVFSSDGTVSPRLHGENMVVYLWR